MAARHIVFVINNLGGGGAERVVATLANHLSRTFDWRVTIVTLRREPVRYELAEGVTVRALRVGRLGIGPLRVLLLPLFALELAWRLRRARPDAVMSFLVRSNLALILTRWFGYHGPVFISERCATDAIYAGNGLGSRVMRALVAGLYPHAAAIVAISRGVKASLQRLGVPGDRVRVIYNPQQIAPLLSVASAKLPGRPFRLVTAGRLTDQKDYPTLFRAFRQVLDSRLDARLVVFGEGPDERSLRALAGTLGLGDRIDWRGWVPSPHRSMAECDAFVLTSKYEGFGNVIVEAMAIGLPVVCTDCEAGPREILGGGEFGLLVPVGDSDAVAKAILRLAGEPELYAALRARAQVRALDFDVAAIAGEYVEVLTSSPPVLTVPQPGRPAPTV
jgi:N-acetylgalactosamine-N,N'-diacetylbacillosaminyl-diphospho-undecaprenol 4-alpha-N-acetylgalactosaminyltransferase